VRVADGSTRGLRSAVMHRQTNENANRKKFSDIKTQNVLYKTLNTSAGNIYKQVFEVIWQKAHRRLVTPHVFGPTWVSPPPSKKNGISLNSVVFYTIHPCVKRTDTQTDTQTTPRATSVVIGRISAYAMHAMRLKPLVQEFSTSNLN